MNKCTEKESWPNEPSDVSPDAYDAFLAHVARCPFHAKALDADAENTRSTFRSARGLNAHGRILVGRELQQMIGEQDRRHGLWKKVAEESILPFRRIYLGNRGEDIAGSGKFFDFRNYEGDHRLDPAAGLQILGIVGEGKPVLEVLLGHYPLCGVEHTGQEQFLVLDNGYTVGLRVKQLSACDFNIGFRCVENAVLELERMGLMHLNNQGVSVPSAPMLVEWATEKLQSLVRSLRTAVKLRKPASVFRNEPATTLDKLEWCLYCVIIFCVCLTGVLWWEDLQAKVFANEFESKAPVIVCDSKPEKPRGRNKGSAPQTAAPTNVPLNKNQKSSADGAPQQASESTDDQHVAPANDKPPVPETKADPNAEEVNIGPAAWYFQSRPPSGAEVGVAIHSGSDMELVKKLTAEMLKQEISISALTRRSLTSHHMDVSWKIRREQTAVTVEATLTANGDRQSLYARSEGSCPEQACDEAVRTAVSKVFAAMRDMSENESSSSDF